MLLDKKNDTALRGLDVMERNCLPIMALSMKESEVLHRVWSAVNKGDDAEKKRDMFVARLEECGEENPCASGRVARVVDSLTTFDTRVAIKPEWALRQEWLQRAAAERSRVPPDTDLKGHLRQILTKEYVDRGLCSASMLNDELHSWGDDF